MTTPHTHTHPFNGPLSGTTQVSRYQKGKTNLDFTGARDSEWQWHQLGHMQVCTSLQIDNHANTPPLSFFTGRMPFLPPNQQRRSTEGQVIILVRLHQRLPSCHGSSKMCKGSVIIPLLNEHLPFSYVQPFGYDNSPNECNVEFFGKNLEQFPHLPENRGQGEESLYPFW